MPTTELDIKLSAAQFQRQKLEGASLWMNNEFIESQQATKLRDILIKEARWEQPVIRMGASVIKSPRLAAWYGDPDAVYTYSGLANIPNPWTETLLELRQLLENVTGDTFNSVLLNLYRNGADSMGWHRDNEPELGDQPVIASLSFGENRKFVVRHVKNKSCRWEIILRNGSALIMAGETQNRFKHCVPKTKVNQGQRVNLTFRKILNNSVRTA